jgi:hypothetical protein
MSTEICIAQMHILNLAGNEAGVKLGGGGGGGGGLQLQPLLLQPLLQLRVALREKKRCLLLRRLLRQAHTTPAILWW